MLYCSPPAATVPVMWTSVLNLSACATGFPEDTGTEVDDARAVDTDTSDPEVDLGVSARALAPVGDWTGDGVGDLFVRGYRTGGRDDWYTAEIYDGAALGGGRGASEPRVWSTDLWLAGGTAPGGDLFGDGTATVVIAEYSIAIYIPGAEAPLVTSPEAECWYGVAPVGDMVGDGRARLLGTACDVDVLTLLDDPTVNTTARVELTLEGNVPTRTPSGDLDGDGLADLGLLASAHQTAAIFLAPMPEQLTWSDADQVVANVRGLDIAADLDGDGTADIATLYGPAIELYTWGADTPFAGIEADDDLCGLQAGGDTNGDRSPDVYAGNQLWGGPWLGTQSAADAIRTLEDGSCPQIVLPDVHGDGKDDIVAALEPVEWETDTYTGVYVDTGFWAGR